MDPEMFTALADAVRARREGWTPTEELLASTLETLHALVRVTLKANGAKDHQLPRPLKVPRPAGVKARQPDPPPAASRAEIAARFSRS